MMDPFISEIVTSFFDYQKFTKKKSNYIEQEESNDNQGSSNQVQLDSGSSGQADRDSQENN